LEGYKIFDNDSYKNWKEYDLYNNYIGWSLLNSTYLLICEEIPMILFLIQLIITHMQSRKRTGKLDDSIVPVFEEEIIIEDDTNFEQVSALSNLLKKEGSKNSLILAPNVNHSDVKYQVCHSIASPQNQIIMKE
jgi:hypothetical protein